MGPRAPPPRISGSARWSVRRGARRSPLRQSARDRHALLLPPESSEGRALPRSPSPAIEPARAVFGRDVGSHAARSRGAASIPPGPRGAERAESPGIRCRRRSAIVAGTWLVGQPFEAGHRDLAESKRSARSSSASGVVFARTARRSTCSSMKASTPRARAAAGLSPALDGDHGETFVRVSAWQKRKLILKMNAAQADWCHPVA